jgi:excisionase family DNA binding protein
MPDDSEYLLLPEVAAACRTSVSTVRVWIAAGRLPSVRPARRRLDHRLALARFLEGAGVTRAARAADCEDRP